MTISNSLNLLSHTGQPPNKTAGAAKDFEGLLLAQILKSSHIEDDDDAASAAVSFGEEQLARSISANGGIGLAKLIEIGLDHASAATHSELASSD